MHTLGTSGRLQSISWDIEGIDSVVILNILRALSVNDTVTGLGEPSSAHSTSAFSHLIRAVSDHGRNAASEMHHHAIRSLNCITGTL